METHLVSKHRAVACRAYPLSLGRLYLSDTGHGRFVWPVVGVPSRVYGEVLIIPIFLNPASVGPYAGYPLRRVVH